MALVKCPECGKENVSSTATACPQCGFNIKEYYEQEKLLRQEEQEAAWRKETFERRVSNVEIPKEPEMGGYIKIFIVLSVFSVICWFGADNEVQQGLVLFAWASLTWLDRKMYSQNYEEYEEALKDAQAYKYKVARRQQAEAEMRERQEELDEKGIPYCPKCGSTHVGLTTRDYKITTGYIGASEAMNICQKCGHKWDPKK